MSSDVIASHKRGKTKGKLISRLLIPMLMLVLLQLVTFFVILAAGGGFSYVREYSYKALAEKTENRKSYVESELQQKMQPVQETADRINELVNEILSERGGALSELQTDAQLSRSIIESSVESVVDLLRRSMANDVYLILETGELYNGADGIGTAKSAIYLRDLDPFTDAGYGDLMMELGYSSISQSYGMALDSGWKLHFEPNESDMQNFDYYYKTIKTAEENSDLPGGMLGCWTGFSTISRGASSSMKYSVPLISGDGTVYGVVGIGLTENSVVSNLPVTDFTSETACYVLGHGGASGAAFDIVAHSGASFGKLVGNSKSISASSFLYENVCDFDIDASVSLAGSIQLISLYDQGSPYADEQWALISVADRGSVLKPFSSLVSMLFVSALVALLVSVLIVILISRAVVRPITSAIETMNDNHEYNEVIRFEPSNIYEIDKMTDAITQLQINVQDFSSQVSKMIRIANVGLGTFMYDRTDDSVFVGQSLLPLLRTQYHADEDVVMDRETFLDSFIDDETRFAVAKSLKNMTEEDAAREYSVAKDDGSIVWMRLSLVHNKNKSIGILEDVTDDMMKKKRIEYERDHDAITGLLNRHAYHRRLDELFSNPEELKITAFLMIDLDNLKFVNDTYGHDFGDDYIKTAAAALRNFEKYGGVVARISGDEFNICLSGFDTKEKAREVIDGVRSQLLGSYCLLADGTHFKIRASIGVSWYPDDSTSFDMLMKYADFAMYTIKHSTKGELAEFDMTAYEKDAVLINGVEEMNRIIDECSVKYAFQSIVSAKTGEVYGYEALMRPQSTVLQSPLELLRIAKTSAKLYEIERLTWTKALDDFRKQIDTGRIGEDSHIFINSISNCIMEPEDINTVEAAHPELLSNVVLEVLESEYVNEEFNERKMERMKKWSAQIALDDFGTGYNSEYALITIHPNIVKIDRSIINGCDKDISRRTIIANLVKLVRTKNVLVLAEGVETEEELKTVISCGVDLLQGYYISRPVFDPQPLPKEVTDKICGMAEPVER